MHVFSAMQEPYTKVKATVDKFKTLGLSKKCNAIRHTLTMLLTNPEIMSEQLAEKLLPSARGVPYHIDSSDPEQVVVLKKAINMLFNIEKMLQELEQINLSETASLTELVALAPKIARSLYCVINQVYEAIQLINHSNASVQAILGPHFNQLKQKMAPLLEQLGQFTPRGALLDQPWGEVFGKAVELLPKEQITSDEVSFNALGQAVFNIPDYFKQLQTMLETGSLFSEPDLSMDPPNPALLKQKEKREKEANAFVANLDSMAVKTWSQGLGIEYVAAIGRLAGFLKDHTKALVQTAIPTSKAAYLRLEEALLNFKRKVLPAIIDELEALEITMGLKPGLLVEPALSAATTYYNKLIETLTTKIEEARVKADNVGVKAFLYVTEKDEDKLELGTKFEVGEEVAHLIDETFVAQRISRQHARLDAARERMYEVQEIAGAAESFFAKISTRPEKLTIQDRQELAFLYQQFQPHMRARDPRLDAEIVSYLNLTEQEKERLSQGAASASPEPEEQPFLRTVGDYGLRLVGQTLFDRILKQDTAVMNAINREIATVATQIDLIQSSQAQVKASSYERMGKKTTLEAISDSNGLNPVTTAENLSSRQLNKKMADLDDQLDELAQARKAFSTFIDTLNEVAKGNKPLSGVDAETKEQLRKHYAQFQKYLFPEENEFLLQWDKQIVQALMQDKPQADGIRPVTTGEIVELEKVIAANMAAIQKRFEQGKELYFQQLQEKLKERPASPIILKPSQDLSKGTLLAQANAAKLSEQFDNSIQKAIEFLQSNLAAEVAAGLRQVDSSPSLPYQIEANDAPVTVFYKTVFNYFYSLIDNTIQKAVGFLRDNLSTGLVTELGLSETGAVKPYQLKETDSSQVSLYKNVINSLCYLRDAVVAVEKQAGHQYTESTLSRALFLGQTGLGLASPAKNMAGALANVANNPQFAALVKILPKELAEFFEQAKLTTAEKMSEAVAKAKVDPRFAVMLQDIPKEVTEYLQHTDDPCLIPKVVDWLEHRLLNFFENTPVEQLEARFNEFEQDFIRFIQDLEAKGVTKTPVTEDGVLVDKILVALHKIKVQIKVEMGEIDNLLGDQWSAPRGQESEEQVAGDLQKLDACLAKYTKSGTPLTHQDQETIKECYKELQPYLAQVDKNYYTNDLLNDSPNYEQVLQKILIQDRTKRIAAIKENRMNRIFHYVLSEGTPALKGVMGALTANIIAQSEPAVEMTVEKSDAMKREEALQEIIEGVKNFPLPASDSPEARQIAQDKEVLISALQGMAPFLLKVTPTPKDVQNLLNAVKGVYAALFNVGVGSRELFLEKMQDFRAAWESVVLLADEAEFSLGLKPGVLSSALNEPVDKFYRGFITSVKTKYSDQDVLKLLGDLNPISIRIANEERRLKNLEETAGSEMTVTRKMEISISRERIAYLAELKLEKEADKIKRFEQFKQVNYEKIINEEIRPSVNEKMGVYANQFFQDVQLLYDERRESMLQDIHLGTPVEAAIREKINSVFVELMTPSPEQSPSNPLQTIKKTYTQLNADYQAIQEIRKQFKSQKNNPLMQEILAKFDAFEEEVKNFANKELPRSNESEKAVYMTQLQEHALFVRSFRDRLGNYQLLVNKENLHNYEELQGEKQNLLDKPPRERNAGMQQKLAYLNTYEKRLIEKCEQGSRHEVAGEINAFVKALNLYDALVEVSANNRKLMAQLQEEIAKLTKPTDRNKLEIKKQQLAIAQDIEAIIGHPEMPIEQKIKILKQFMVNDSQDNKAVYTGDFGKIIQENLSVVNKFSAVEERKFSFFSSHSQGSYVSNVTPETLLPKIEKKIAELEGKNDKSSTHKREVLKAAQEMLRDRTGSREELAEVIRKYPEYDSGIGPSDTKKLAHQAMGCLETQAKQAGLAS
ncbi:protein SidH [Legionella donaldsonii]|uniref:Protein SidH n=1 Tax=Legionella donaldsonii TaxID=45060 RepID=A0A378J4L5_9GAMM|nr:hypothetical protein [Legionella donaldsonii]STX41857.1 protein SidH [Legionella donaldsonii]